MDTLNEYRDKSVRILRDWERFPGPEADFRIEAVIDRDKDRYLLQDLSWEDGRRVYYTLVHVDIIDGKFWIQVDNTQTGIATELLAAGIPKDKIVLAFYPKQLREQGEFAIA